MIIRWILSHSVMLLVLVAILFAVWKIEDLHTWLPDVATRSVPTASTDVPSVKVPPGGEALAVEKTTKDAAAESVKTQSVVAGEDKHAGKAPSGTMTDEGHTEISEYKKLSEYEERVVKFAPDTAPGAQKPMTGPEATHPKASVRQPGRQEAPTSAALNSPAEAQSPDGKATDTVDAESLRQEWISARNAYWQEDLRQAEDQYLALQGVLPENPDILGELANLYYARGDLQQAVETYYEAGLLLRKAGRIDEARILAHEIHRLDADMAVRLMNQLEGASKN